MSFTLGVLEASAVGGICILAFLAISQIIGHKYRSRYKMLVWFLIVVRLLIPFHLEGGETLTIIEISVDSFEDGITENYNANDKSNDYDIMQDDITLGSVRSDQTHQNSVVSKNNLVTFWYGILAMWLAGASIYLIYFVSVYLVTSKKLGQNSWACTSEKINRVAKRIGIELEINKLPEIRMVYGYASPFAIGFIKNIIYIPDKDYTEKELAYLIRHELCHCKNRDIIKKWVFIIVNALHWFNPIVWLMRKSISQDIELICDEEVLCNATKAERAEYSELIMSCINTEIKVNWNVSTGYTQGFKFTKQRFNNIFDMKKKGRGVIIIAGAMCFLLLASFGIRIKAPVIVPDKAYQAFIGTLESEAISLISYLDDNLVTIYYTNNDGTESGKFSGTYNEENNSFVLSAPDSTNWLEGSFYTKNNGRLFIKGNLIVANGNEQVIDVVRTKSYSNQEDMKVVFKQEGIWDYDPLEVLAFIEVFTDAVQRDDKELLASMMSYPLTIIEDNRTRIIENTQQFLNSYDSIITKEMKKKVVEDSDDNLFINYLGVHFGNVIFYSPDTGIFNINNITSAKEYPTDEEGGIPSGSIEKG